MGCHLSKKEIIIPNNSFQLNNKSNLFSYDLTPKMCEISQEKYLKLSDKEISNWFHDYTENINTLLPMYIMFKNKTDCFIKNKINKIKIQLDKMILKDKHEKIYEFFNNYNEYEISINKIIKKARQINDHLELFEKISEDNVISKFLRYTNINIYNNDIKPFIIYKKLLIKYDFYYIPLNKYNFIKNQINIIKTIQILELLGCKELHLESIEINNKTKKISSSLKLLDKLNISNEVEVKKQMENNLNRNNKYEFLDRLFEDEEELLIYININPHIFMNLQDYLSDIELKYMIRSRIHSHLKEYHRNFYLKKLDSIEGKVEILLNLLNVSMGLDTKYLKSTYKEIQYNVNCKFFSLMDVMDLSSLPLDIIGFNTIKNKILKNESDIFSLTNKIPVQNDIVLVSIHDNKFIGKVKEILLDNMYSVELLYNNSIINTKLVNISYFKITDDNDFDKYKKEINIFLERMLIKKYLKYLKVSNKNINNIHEFSYLSYFRYISKINEFDTIFLNIDTFNDIKEIINFVKYSGYFVYLNRKGFEKMKNNLEIINNSELNIENCNMFIKRILILNEFNVEDFNKIKKNYVLKTFNTYEKIIELIIALKENSYYCPIIEIYVNKILEKFIEKDIEVERKIEINAEKGSIIRKRCREMSMSRERDSEKGVKRNMNRDVNRDVNRYLKEKNQEESKCTEKLEKYRKQLLIDFIIRIINDYISRNECTKDIKCNIKNIRDFLEDTINNNNFHDMDFESINEFCYQKFNNSSKDYKILKNILLNKRNNIIKFNSLKKYDRTKNNLSFYLPGINVNKQNIDIPNYNNLIDINIDKQTQQPEILQLETNKQTLQLETLQLETQQSETLQSETQQLETLQLETQPGTQQPETRQPETGTQQPGTRQPVTRQPETRQPETRQPISLDVQSINLDEQPINDNSIYHVTNL